MNQTVSKYIFQLSATGLLIALIFRPMFADVANYVFAVCAAGVAIVRMNFRYEGKNVRLKRLYRMEMFAAILLVVSSYLMFKNRNEWMISITVAAVLQLYTAFLIPSIKKKE